MASAMRTAAGIACVCILALPGAWGQCGAAWETAVGNPGANSTVWSLTSTSEASAVGPALYAGGQFSSVGGTAAKNIAVWNGVAWSPLGTGAENGGVVYAMVVSDGVLYAGGAFGNMGGLAGTKRIAQWDGSTWSDVGGGMSENNAGIRALTFFDGDLYAGGYLNEIGGVTAHKLAKWDGVAWSALPGDPMGSTDIVRALAAFDDGGGEALYVGGDFEDAGGDSNADYILRWDGVSLTALGRGANDDVEALAVWNGELYVAGQFTRVYQADGTEVIANKIAKWDGTTWHALGDGMNTELSYHVWTLAVFDDGAGEALYAGGNFTTAGGLAVDRIAAWDGASWLPVGSADLNGYVYALDTWAYEGGMYVGGTFTTSGTPSANRIVQWGRPLPVSPVDAAADPDTIIVSETSELTASAGGATIEWYTDGCEGTLVGSGEAIIVSPTETTTYYARAFDGTCRSYLCDSIMVTVNCAPPTIALQPTGGVICSGHTHELCVSATGSGTLHYQWLRNGLSLTGAVQPCYQAAQAGTYWCVVTDDCGPTESDAAGVLAATPTSGDFDGDGDADEQDFFAFDDCMGGPGGGVSAGCECVDVNGDDEIDLIDMAAFQIVFGS